MNNPNCKTGPIWVCQAINIFRQCFVLPNRNQEGFVLMSSVCLFTIFFVGKSRPYLKLFTSRVKAAFPREAPSYNIYFLKNKYTRVPASIWYSLGKTSWYILANFGTHFLGKNLFKLFARKCFWGDLPHIITYWKIEEVKWLSEWTNIKIPEV